MVEYCEANVKLTDTQLKKLKNSVKNKTRRTLRLNLKIFDGNDLSHDLLLTTRQKTKLRNSFDNNISTDLNLSKDQISNIIQHGGFLGSFLRKLAGPLMKVVVRLAKNVLVPLEITAAVSAKTINNETKKQKGGFLNMLLGTLGASLLGNLLVRKGIAASMNQDLMVFIQEITCLKKERLGRT